MNEKNELVEGAELYRTKGRGRLHVLGCSHLQTTDLSQLIVADATDRAERELCSECDKEIRGVGRTEYPSLDAAFEALKFPVENRPRMREIAAELDFDLVWAPQARSYVAVGHRDRHAAAAAYFNRGFVDVHIDTGGYTRHELPTAVQRGGGDGRRQVAERNAATCPTCFLELPASGTCDTCD